MNDQQKIVKIIGGLGNQMFQYAFYRYLKLKGYNARIDISAFRNYQLHYGFELQRIFKLDTSEAEAKQADLDAVIDQAPLFKVRKIVDRKLFGASNKLVKDSHWVEPNYSAYYPEAAFQDKSYLEGYWQNDAYLNDQRDELLHLYHWQNISPRNQELIAKMQTENAISVHIRRLDSPHSIKQFMYMARLRLVWRVASTRYYKRAISYFKTKVEQPVFYVFTDNIEWFKKNLAIADNMTLVDWNRGQESNQDMLLMSQCKHNIISMSSFSWWGAWLNKNQDKIVVAPKKWAVRFKQELGIIPKTWIRL